MRILIVAADPLEFRGLLSRVAGFRRQAFAVSFARAGAIAGHDTLLIANGMGPRRAAAAVAAADPFQPEAIVSTGFCGALDHSLAIADVIAATEVIGGSRIYPARPIEAPRQGRIVSIAHVAQTAAEKRKLRETGASAVEMEAAAVAEAARQRGLPFYCVRAVTDLADESMANDFNRALRDDGHLDTIVILRGALGRPTSRVPELLRLRSRCVRAAEALGEFFVGCRF
jgi:adenosylhomocysteine nucleosidase